MACSAGAFPGSRTDFKSSRSVRKLPSDYADKQCNGGEKNGLSRFTVKGGRESDQGIRSCTSLRTSSSAYDSSSESFRTSVYSVVSLSVADFVI